jgi:hypothetical protein
VIRYLFLAFLFLSGTASANTLSGGSILSGGSQGASPGSGGTGTSTVFTEGSVVFAGPAGAYSQDNANFAWNDTTNVLTVGALISGTSTFTGAVMVSGANFTVSSGNITANSGSVSSQRFIATGSTVATNGLYLPGTNTPAISANSLRVMSFSSVGSAVNYWNMKNAADAGSILALAEGTSTDIGITITPKGAGASTINGTISMPNMANVTTAVTGAVCWNTGGAVTYNNSTTCLLSSRRFKDEIGPVKNGLEEVLMLKPMRYTYKDQSSVKGEQVGFIAEDVFRVDPRLVALDPVGKVPQAVRYENLTAVLAKAIQEQHAEIMRQRAALESLGVSTKCNWVCQARIFMEGIGG